MVRLSPMARKEDWRRAHEEAGADLGAVRFAERMPPKYKGLIVPGVLAAVMLALGLLMWYGTRRRRPRRGAAPKQKSKHEGETLTARSARRSASSSS
jgi:hypothetical protein